MSESRNNHNIASVVYPVAEPLSKELGLEIWDIKLVKEGPNQYLRIFIDKDSGITLDDCEKMSRALDVPLDELDPIPDSYFLEVCSPGIERELSTEVHLKKFQGSVVKIKLIRPDENNEKEIIGKLETFDKNQIVIRDSQNREKNVSRKNIVRINLKY